MIITGKRGSFNQRNKSAVVLNIIVTIIIALVFAGILNTTITFIKNNNVFSAQSNTPAQETMKIENSTNLTFAVISDIHIQSSVSALERFNKALLDLTENIQPKPDAIVMNGDLGNGTPEDYALLSSMIKNRHLNTEGNPLWFASIGNHEFYNAYHDPRTRAWQPASFPNGDNDTKAIERFLDFTKQEKVYNDTYLKGYHFIFLGSEKSAMSDKSIGEAAYLSSEQLSWLDEKLKENYIKNKPIFVFLHQPLFNSSGNIGSFVIRGERLNNILKKYREIIMFSGHLHLTLGSPGTVKHNVFTIYNASSTSRPISQGLKSETGKSEGLYVEVFKDKVEVKGRDFISKAWIFDNVTTF